MAFTHGQSNTAVASGTSLTCVLSNPVSNNDVLVAILRTADSSIPLTAVSDNRNGKWDGITATTGSPGIALAWKINSVPAASLTLTVTSVATGAIRIALSRFKVTDGSAQLVSTATHAISVTNTAIDCGTIANDLGKNLLVGGGGAGTNSLVFTAGASNGVSATIGAQVGDATNGSIFDEYVLSTAAGTQTMTATVSPTTTINMWEATFATIRTRTLLGVGT